MVRHAGLPLEESPAGKLTGSWGAGQVAGEIKLSQVVDLDQSHAGTSVRAGNNDGIGAGGQL